jgi:hypothetical protein
MAQETEIAARVGISRPVTYHGTETGQLDRDVDALPGRRVRSHAPTKLDSYKPTIEARLATYPELRTVRLFQEVRAAG